MKSVLSRYIASNFFKSFLVVFLCFFIIVSILESMEIVRRYFSGGYNPSVFQIVKLTFCKTTISMCSFFSFTVLLAVIVFYTTMHNKLELNVIKGAGISPFGILKPICLAISLLSVFYVTIFDGISVCSYKIVRNANTSIKGGLDDGKNLTITNRGIWFRDVLDDRSYIISARGFNQNESSMFNVRFFEFNKDGDLEYSAHASTAAIKNGNWNLSNCKVVTSTGDESTQKLLKLPTKLSYTNINKMVTSPNSVLFWSIGKYVSMLDRVGLSSLKYQIHWFSRLATILQMFAFAVIATAFCINHNYRNHKAYVAKVSLLMVLAFPAHFINNIVLAYGESGELPIFVASFAVPFFILLSGILLVSKK